MTISYNTSIVRNGLVLYLDAANVKSYPGTGTTWNDLSGNGNNGTLVNGVGYSADNKGTMVLDGTNDYISTNLNINFNNSRLYTFEVWFYDTSPGLSDSTNTAIISNYETSTVPYVGFHINSSGNAFITERNTQPSSAIALGSLNVCDGKWYNIVVVADTTLKLYINGNLNAQANSRPGGTITSGQNIVIGGNHLNRFQSCSISTAKIYLDRALTSAEVKQNFEALRGRYGI
jgi:hypothetical protein